MRRNWEEGVIHPTCLTLPGSQHFCLETALPDPAATPLPALCVTRTLRCYVCPLRMSPETQIQGRILQPTCWQLVL